MFCLNKRNIQTFILVMHWQQNTKTCTSSLEHNGYIHNQHLTAWLLKGENDQTLKWMYSAYDVTVAMEKNKASWEPTRPNFGKGLVGWDCLSRKIFRLIISRSGDRCGVYIIFQVVVKTT